MYLRRHFIQNKFSIQQAIARIFKSFIPGLEGAQTTTDGAVIRRCLRDGTVSSNLETSE
jgi:hypothetical protein